MYPGCEKKKGIDMKNVIAEKWRISPSGKPELSLNNIIKAINIYKDASQELQDRKYLNF